MEVVFKEAKRILYGILVVDILIFIVSIILKSFDIKMAMGIVLGSAITYLNFILMGMSAAKALQKEELEAKKKAIISYIIRYLGLFLVCGVIIYLDIANPFGLLLPLLSPKLTYFAIGIFMKGE